MPALAAASFLGPIVPAACNCAGGAGFACLILVIKNLFSFAIWFGTIACVAMIAYGGFLLVLNAANVSYRDAARKLFTNAGIGLVIVLAAWLLVDTVFTTLTKTTLARATSVFSGGTDCLGDSQNIAGQTQNIAPDTTPHIPIISITINPQAIQGLLPNVSSDIAYGRQPRLAAAALTAVPNSSPGLCSDPLANLDSTHLSSDQVLTALIPVMQACSSEVAVAGVVYNDGSSKWISSTQSSGYQVRIATTSIEAFGSLRDKAEQELKQQGVIAPDLGTFYFIHTHPESTTDTMLAGRAPPSGQDILGQALSLELPLLALSDQLATRVQFMTVAPEGVYSVDTTGLAEKYVPQFKPQLDEDLRYALFHQANIYDMTKVALELLPKAAQAVNSDLKSQLMQIDQGFCAYSADLNGNLLIDQRTGKPFCDASVGNPYRGTVPVSRGDALRGYNAYIAGWAALGVNIKIIRSY